MGGNVLANETALRIGISNRSLLGLPILVAQEKGFFEKEGLKVSLDYFAGGVPATTALIGGSVQFVDAAFDNGIKAVKKGQPVVSIVNLQTDFAGALIVRNETVRKLGRKPMAADLKGLRVGTLARGGFADVSTRYIAAEAGLVPDKDVELVPIRGADRQLAAGDANEIDVAFVMEPWNVIAVDQHKKWQYLLDLTRGEGPEIFQGLSYTTLQTTRGYLQQNRPVAEKVVRAVVSALQYIADPVHLDDVAEIANREYGNPGVAVIKKSLQRQLHSFHPDLPEHALKKQERLLLQSQSITPPVPRYAELVDVSFKPLWNAFKQGRK
jgi:NitT/TauT family transport system substrate-binding protein